MSQEALFLLPIIYVVFLFSIVCHEAAHALVAKWGGDLTAYSVGQVTIDPMPHIKREPFGLVFFPLYSLLSSGVAFGWGSAPFDPYWQIRYPRRAALMALAGPVANFMIAIAAVVLMRVGVAVGLFVPIGPVAVTSLNGGMLEGLGFFLSQMFSLNILLGVFNLLPVPPLDGFSVLGLVLPERSFLRLIEVARSPMVSIFGLVVAIVIARYLVFPVQILVERFVGFM
ncbi:MAG: site-2 protease family protein [Pseudomonadota bacterium]|jgi:Zn-dependent protease